MFDRYLPLIKALHVNWLSRRHQFSPIPDSNVSARMASSTCIILKLLLLCDNDYWDSSVLDSIWNTACDEVWQNMIPEYRICDIIPFFGGDTHHKTALCILDIHQCFVSSSTRSFISIFYLFRLTECLCTPFDIFLGGTFSISQNYCMWCGQGSFGDFAFIILLHLNHNRYYMLSENQLIAATLVLGFPNRIIIRLIVYY